jgi:hypothetical protein
MFGTEIKLKAFIKVVLYICQRIAQKSKGKERNRKGEEDGKEKIESFCVFIYFSLKEGSQIKGQTNPEEACL